MTRDITVNDTEFLGAVKTRFIEVDISNYDDDGGNDGESFGPTDAGLSRFQQVHCDVDPGATTAASTQVNAVAQYDSDVGAIRLYYAGTSGGSLTEVSSNANEGTVVQIAAMGK